MSWSLINDLLLDYFLAVSLWSELYRVHGFALAFLSDLCSLAQSLLAFEYIKFFLF